MLLLSPKSASPFCSTFSLFLAPFDLFPVEQGVSVVLPCAVPLPSRPFQRGASNDQPPHGPPRLFSPPLPFSWHEARPPLCDNRLYNLQRWLLSKCKVSCSAPYRIQDMNEKHRLTCSSVVTFLSTSSTPDSTLWTI
jgi:hypothetical protein